MLPAPRILTHFALFLFAGLLITPARADDFRPAVEDALRRGDKQIVIPPGVYRLAPEGGNKCVWTVRKAADVEIIADGVTLVSTRLTRAVTLTECRNLTLSGLTIDYDPPPFTQGRVVSAAEDHSWIEVKIDAGYPRQPYARIDVVDPATRYRKWGMPFLWGTRAEMRGDDVVRVLRDGIGKAAAVGDLASLSTGPTPDGIPHAVELDRCENTTLRGVTVHSAPGMGILEADGEGGNQFLQCRVVPGPVPAGATEPRLLSTSWDAMQSKTIRRGPRVEGCEIREAGDDSWSVQSSDFLVLRKTGPTLILASRDAHTRGVQTGDRLTTAVGAPEAVITARQSMSRDEAGLDDSIRAKLTDAPHWSMWRVAPSCIEVTLDRELAVAPGDSLFSPDRMGNGFVFANNRIHSSGRLLIKAAGRVEGNVLDTPHAIVVCPEVPGAAAAGIAGLVIRGNTIRHAGGFCPAYESSQAGALSITRGAGAHDVAPAGTFHDLLIEDNLFEDCTGPQLVVTSTRGLVIRNNRFVRPHHLPAGITGAAYGIAKDAVIWIAKSENVDLGPNPVTAPGPHSGAPVVQKP
jgi:hypothetical protein